MTAEIFEFPEKSMIAWHHVAPAVRNIALERSGSQEIAARVVDAVGQAYERSVPASFTLRSDSVESMRDDAAAMLNQVVGALVAEITTFATDAEMLLVDHDPQPHRGK